MYFNPFSFNSGKWDSYWKCWCLLWSGTKERERWEHHFFKAWRFDV